MKPAKCPFYPDSCTVEFHPNMQHVWRERGILFDLTLSVPATSEEVLRQRAAIRPTADLVQEMMERVVTNKKAPGVTNKASERAQAWNKANRKQYNARQKTLMQARRGKRGG